MVVRQFSCIRVTSQIKILDSMVCQGSHDTSAVLAVGILLSSLASVVAVNVKTFAFCIVVTAYLVVNVATRRSASVRKVFEVVVEILV